jgi:hypothetical protein
MKTFSLTLFDGHPIIEDSSNIILLDTGAPTTIHIADRIEFMGDMHKATTDYMGLTTDSLSELLGTRISTLLAADIIGRYKVLFDYTGRSVTFGENDFEFHGETIHVRNVMGIPIVELSTPSGTAKCFLDSGAKLSYLDETFTGNLVSEGTEEDFYPGVGKFETKTYKIPTKIGQEQFTARYGNLPMLLQMSLALTGAAGVIGFDLFNNFSVMLDIRGNLLKLRKSTTA